MVSCKDKSHANGTEALQSCTKEIIMKLFREFFTKCRDYERAYDEGFSSNEVEQQLKLYKSHHKVQSMQYLMYIIACIKVLKFCLCIVKQTHDA